MLYQLHLLVFDAQDGWRMDACGSRSWRPTVLVPRQLCVFESVPCGQVRLHEMSGFARVQARRLSPFRRVGVSAIRRGGRLHLWMWDADEVDALLAQCSGASTRLVAESVYLPWPQEDGEHRIRCSQTEDLVTCRGGAIVEAGLGAALPADVTAITSKPAGFEWGGGVDGASTGTRSFDGARNLNHLGLMLALATLGYASYEGGSLLASRDVAVALETQLERYTVERGQRTGLEAELRADERWLEQYLQASSQLDLVAVLALVRPVLESQGVVIRELEAAGDQLRMVLVTAGGDMKLPDLLQALQRLAGIQKVRLEQHRELGEATFVFDVPGFVVRQPIHGSVTDEVVDGQH